ncbi:Sodium/potassium/calcium exchanger 3 [Dissostichus eleginoides]|uniref:Sodium/potassium/calcium exchanger 3 n=1 Tax=Dissostichus eleginoides TaxID=100907 RepID=A0AAD9CSM0_DISEL|nr:Sodium/potassium/calcium exchanger 3 [Dissostichus eleginoides]
MKAPRRPRQTRLLPRLCVCGVGLLAAAWIFNLNHVSGSHAPTVDHDISKRELTQQEEESNQTEIITKSAISDFPEDIFSLQQRRQGAVLLHVLCAMYMFYALAIVCDVYFVPSLEKISENLQLSQDLFTSLIGVFITKGDVGVGTIVGSAVFNILVIIGLCGIFAGQPITLSWWPLFRDAFFYILSILVLILVIYDEKVMWWETIILMSMYGVYIIIMNWVERRCSRGGQPCLSSLRRGAAVGSFGDCDNDMVPLKPDSCVAAGQDPGVVMVDELLNLHPHQLSFSEASLRLLITPHFPPFTRLGMAGRMVISERQRLIQARGGSVEGGASGEEGLGANGAWGRENGAATEGDRQPLEGERGKETEGEREGVCLRLRWLLSWPLSVLLYFTIPDCSLPRWERWYLLSFLSSTLWIALYSYLMVWMMTIISNTLGIPEVLMGITFLAAGTSVPDCLASLIVARQGVCVCVCVEY